MSEIKTVKCDFCGAIKGKTNHWWIIWVSSEGAGALVIEKANEQRIRVKLDPSDACSEKCVTVGVSRYLAGQPLTS